MSRMKGSKAPTRRRRNNVSPLAASLSPTEDLPIATANLIRCLPPGFSTAVVAIVAETDEPTPVSLRPFQHLSCTTSDRELRLSLANFFHALPPSFHTLPLLSNLVALTTPELDTATLSVCLRVILRLLHTKPRDEPIRDAFSRSLPTLLPTLQKILFVKPSLSVSSSSSVTPPFFANGASQSGFLSARHYSLHLLIALAETVPRPLTHYWLRLLPAQRTVMTSHSTHSNLTTIVLYESRTEIRSLAVTAITTLVSSSKTFIRNSQNMSRLSKSAFTPSSARVLICALSLFPVLEICLIQESNGVIVAKLARLTAQLFSAMPPHALPGLPLKPVLQALLGRALDQPRTDLTARVACASALSNALSSSAPFVELHFLRSVSSRVVGYLQPNQPIIELLSVVRAIFEFNYVIFSDTWSVFKQRLGEICKTPEIRLHAVRTVNAFLAGCIRSQYVNLGDEILHRDITLAIDTYVCLIQNSCDEHHRVLCTSAIMAIQQLLQLHFLITTQFPRHKTLGKLNIICRDAVQNTKCLATNCTGAIRASAVRALGHSFIPLDDHFADDMLQFLYKALCSSDGNNSTVVKCMSAMSMMLDNLLNHFSHLISGDTIDISRKSLVFSEALLKKLCSAADSTASKSASERANEESNKVAAISLISSVICVNTRSGTEVYLAQIATHEKAVLHFLCALVQTGSESLNVRCNTCKAIVRILNADTKRFLRRHGGYFKDVIIALIQELSPTCSRRLQIAAASSLTSIVSHAEAQSVYIEIIEKCIECHLHVASHVFESNQIDRTQRSILQKMVGNLIFKVFEASSTSFPEEVTTKWKVAWESDILVDCVSSYVSLSKYLKYEGTDDTVFLECVPPEKRAVMEKIVQVTNLLRSKTMSISSLAG